MAGRKQLSRIATTSMLSRGSRSRWHFSASLAMNSASVGGLVASSARCERCFCPAGAASCSVAGGGHGRSGTGCCRCRSEARHRRRGNRLLITAVTGDDLETGSATWRPSSPACVGHIAQVSEQPRVSRRTTASSSPSTVKSERVRPSCFFQRRRIENFQPRRSALVSTSHKHMFMYVVISLFPLLVRILVTYEIE